MIFSRRRCRCFRDSFVILVLCLSKGFYGFAFQPTIDPLRCRAQRKSVDICEKTIIPSYLGSADPPPKTTQIPRLGGNTRLSVFGVTSIDSASPILLSFDAGPTTTVGVLGFGVLAAAIGAFVFANVAYTPEIMEGAQEMRQSNREVEIRKLVNAVRSHTDEGNEPAELRLPLETALGKTLEDYAAAVDLSSGDNDDTGGGDYLIVTAADKDLAKAIKQII